MKRFVGMGTVSQELGLSPTRIRELTESGVFQAERTAGGHRRYDLDEVRAAWLRYRLTQAGLPDDGAVVLASGQGAPTVERTDELAGLAEDQVWQELEPRLRLADGAAAQEIAQYVFTEMLNNAIDHSGGSQARIRVWSAPAALVIEIGDDGIGAFRRLAEGKELPSVFSAVQELTKGKQTTAPDRHTGEGIFFSSKAVDLFSLAANGIVWTVDNLRSDQAVGISTRTVGTVVRLEIDPRTERDLGALFRQFTEDLRFTRTRPVVKLFGLGVRFVSRSEAKRLLVGMDQFTEVDIDFAGVEGVGQGFVDELFRVWQLDHPQTRLYPVNMNDAVEFMITRGLPDLPR